jgi:hypothetical protein
MTLASAVVVLGTLGGGIGVAARQHGIETPRKEAPAQRPQSPASPARKDLEAAKDALVKYEKQLNVAQDMISRLNTEIVTLKTRIHALESRDNAQPAKAPNSGAEVSSKREASGEGPAVAATATDVAFPDFITSSPGVIVSQSARRDRVVILATGTGTARSYRPPQGSKVMIATVWKQYVLIASNGPTVAHLAAYDLNLDRWTTANFRGSSQDFPITIVPPEPGSTLVAPHFQGSPLTQVAVFDSPHFRWSVQDLVEPSDMKSVRPHLKGNVALYVLGREICAYSTQAGRWDVLTLDKPFIRGSMTRQQPLVDDDSAAVSQGGRLHVFTAKTGRWQTIDPKD